jgi:hypothetical protein
MDAREDSGWDPSSAPDDPVVSPDDNLVFETDVFVEGPGVE